MLAVSVNSVGIIRQFCWQYAGSVFQSSSDLRLEASSICQSVILIWIKINFNLMWINEMQIEHVLANVDNGSHLSTTTMARPFEFDSDEFNTILLASFNSGLIIDGRYK